MTVRLFAFTCGWLTGPLEGFLRGESGRIKVPIPCYLIEHPKGRVLFDTGLHPAVQRDPAGRLGVMAKIFTADFHAGEDVAARLGALGIEPSGIQWIVSSHLHFDHTGGNEVVPHATVVVQRREWEAGHDARAIRANGYDPKDYDTGHELLLVDGEHDLFGDGTVVCVPSYGHTPGHQSLRVRLASGDVLLASDACYLRQTLEALHLPSIAHDPDAMLDVLHEFRRQRDAGARIFYGHDPEFWESVPQAPAAIV